MAGVNVRAKRGKISLLSGPSGGLHRQGETSTLNRKYIVALALFSGPYHQTVGENQRRIRSYLHTDADIVVSTKWFLRTY